MIKKYVLLLCLSVVDIAIVASRNTRQPHAFSSRVENTEFEFDIRDFILRDRTCKAICAKYQLQDATPIEIDAAEYWCTKQRILRELLQEGTVEFAYVETWRLRIQERLEKLSKDFPNGKRESFSYNPKASYRTSLFDDRVAGCQSSAGKHGNFQVVVFGGQDVRPSVDDLKAMPFEERLHWMRILGLTCLTPPDSEQK